jgi:hypothetical protein
MSTPIMKAAVGAVISWVRLYTIGLDADAKDARRAEIESDLWEHGAGNGAEGVGPQTTALQVLARLILGVPADLSWRLEQRGAQRKARSLPGIGSAGALVRSARARWGLGLAVLFGGFTIMFGVRIFVRHVGEDAFAAALFGIGAIVAAVLMLTGFVISDQASRKGAVLLTIGAVTITILHFWMFFIYIPVALTIIITGIRRSRRLAKERDDAVAA